MSCNLSCLQQGYSELKGILIFILTLFLCQIEFIEI
jgi:hypothetical protein